MITTYVIGCDERPDRKNATLAHLRDRGVSATFWRSVHGATWQLETLREYDVGRRISPGHVGLCLGS